MQDAAVVLHAAGKVIRSRCLLQLQQRWLLAAYIPPLCCLFPYALESSWTSIRFRIGIVDREATPRHAQHPHRKRATCTEWSSGVSVTPHTPNVNPKLDNQYNIR